MANTVNYHDVLADIGLRINAIVGAQASSAETNYLVRPLTTTQFSSPDFPFSATKRALQLAEIRYVNAIAETYNHPWRSAISNAGASKTSNLSSGADLPALNSAGKPIVGVWGSVRDAADGIVLTEAPLELIRIKNRNANSWSVIPAYNFKIDGARIYHTRTNVTIDCCVYDADTQASAIDSNAVMLLPDALYSALVYAGVAILCRDNKYMEQASLYEGKAMAAEQAIRQGQTSVIGKGTPGPTTVAQAN